MHHSRLCTFMLDTPPGQFKEAIEFWQSALGVKPRYNDPDRTYTPMDSLAAHYRIIMQRLENQNDTPGIHLDIETDNVEAEVARLEALGATRIEQIEDWWVLNAPSGHIFCVVPPQCPGFPEGATLWQ